MPKRETHWPTALGHKMLRIRAFALAPGLLTGQPKWHLIKEGEIFATEFLKNLQVNQINAW